MNLLKNRGILLAALGALVITLAAWLLPLPNIIAGQEALAAKVLPQTRTALQLARTDFSAARDRYQNYIHTHDLAALLTQSRAAVARAKQNPDDLDALIAVRDSAAEVTAYASELQSYAASSDAYFAALRHYDDDLMSWTRSLGAASESLRPATFPFVEHLKKYPQPVGEQTDPPMVKAEDVANQINALQQHVLGISPDPNPNGGDKQAALDGIDADITAIWASGRSAEYIGGLHPGYDTMLQTYDTQVAEAAQNSASAGATGARRLFAGGLNLLVGLLTFLGIAVLLAPRARTRA